MSHTSTSIHNVIKIVVSEVRHADGHRWQKIDLTMSDASTHSISVFLEPEAMPAVTQQAGEIQAKAMMDSIREARIQMQQGQRNES